MAPIVWTAAVALIAECCFAAYAWREIPMRYLRPYLLAWVMGTTVFLSPGIVISNMTRMSGPLGRGRALTVVVLLALVIVPVGRIGLTPSRLSRIHHR